MSTVIQRPFDVDALTLAGWLSRGEAELIDVRETDEYRRQRIAVARHMPLSAFDPDRVGTNGNKRVVFHCRSGRRSIEAAARVMRAHGCDGFHLAGGILAWKAAGLPVENDHRQPLEIMRQVQLTVGAGVFVCSLLAATVSPWFLLGSGFFGAGLVFAGATGTCGMASLLTRMPWNRAS